VDVAAGGELDERYDPHAAVTAPHGSSARDARLHERAARRRGFGHHHPRNRSKGEPMSIAKTARSEHDDPADPLDGSEAEQFWEPHYRGRAQMLIGRANPVLVQVAGHLPAGRALDLGCGEGGDAVWLVRHGWRVTAVDVAATALSRAREHAATAGVADQIDFQRHDLTRSVPAGTFDLVSAQYLQSPVTLDRGQVLRSVADSVAVGGLLLLVDHASVPPWSWADPATRFPTPGQLLDSLELPPGQWEPWRLEAASRQATGPGGQSATVTDNVVAVRRLAR
jgi:SAM-dependent methyltransferase